MISLSYLEEIDHEILALLTSKEINAVCLTRLLEKRTQLLSDISRHKVKPEPQRWSVATQRTESILMLVKQERDKTAKKAMELLKNKKSINTYRHFA